MRLINLFAVAPEADEAFLADWEGERVEGGVLHRALRADVDFRFVELADVDAATYASHPGLYEVVHEDGAPDGSEGVVLVNPFEVPAGEGEPFVAAWQRVREVFAAQRGYLGTRLHRSVGGADFRYVNVARWSSPLMFARALKRPDFQRVDAGMRWPCHPALYSVIGD
jgi:heme-degrading monooxygenase HmoA